jgi:hypothetical protein
MAWEATNRYEEQVETDPLPAWARRVVDDLDAFIELGTVPSVDLSADALDVKWVGAGRRHRAIFRQVVDDEGRKSVWVTPTAPQPLEGEIPYSSYLAGSGVADLRRLAENMKRQHGARRAASRRSIKYGSRTLYLEDVFVTPRVKGAETSEHDGIEFIKKWTDRRNNSGNTQIVFLTAEAGQGKSSTLRQATVIQAERYLRRETETLLFYVDAQGSGMARLDQVIAKALDDLQSSLSYRTAEALVREGLLILVIDGFDELIGMRGTYQDPFSSLSAFVTRLDGRGGVLAATRTVYYEQEYADRPGVMGLNDDLSYELHPVSLTPWQPTDRDAFLQKLLDAAQVTGDERSQVSASFREVTDADHEQLLMKPLFAREALLLVLTDGLAGAQDHESIVDRLVRSYLVRETREKLLLHDGGQARPLLTIEQLQYFYGQIAEEMWNLETRELDSVSVRLIADMFSDQETLSVAGRELLQQRANTLAMFEPGTPALGTIQFEHEIFFWYFLAFSLADELRSAHESGLRRIMAKSALSPDAAVFLARFARRDNGGSEPQLLLDGLAGAASTAHPRQPQVSENAGVAAAALLRLECRRVGTIYGLRIRGITFAGADLTGVEIASPTLENVVFRRADMRNTKLREGHARSVRLHEPIVEPNSTLLDLDGLDPARDIMGLQLVTSSGVRVEYNPRRILEILRECGAVADAPPQVLFEVDEDVLGLVMELCRAYERINPLGEKHPQFGWIFERQEWPRIRNALLSAGLITAQSKQVQGPARAFFRKQFVPSELVSALYDPHARSEFADFWSQISSEQ